jgi:hypothetical protein
MIAVLLYIRLAWDENNMIPVFTDTENGRIAHWYRMSVIVGDVRIDA